MIFSAYKFWAVLIIVGLLSAGGFGLVKYGRALERADHAIAVVGMQEQIAALGQRIYERESEAADTSRKLTQLEKEKIDAIKSNDHKTAKIKSMEKAIQAIRDAEDKRNYRVIITDSTQRVWNEGRNCGGLPESERSGVLQKRLPEVTGDDINELIKYAQKEYCGVALKYNQLWRAAERLAAESGKKIPSP